MSSSSSRIWTLENQLKFSKVSGDFNPMHIDPVKARRCIFGKAVVHGIHSVLWGLDEYFSSVQKKGRLKKMRAVFNKPVGLQELITYSAKETGKSEVNISLKSEDIPTTEISFEWEQTDFKQNGIYNFESPFEMKAPREMKDTEFLNFSEEFEMRTEMSEVQQLFPALTKYIPWEQIVTILMTTRIVGMECPGLHSIFNELNLDFEQSIPTERKLRYNVALFHESFRLVKIQLTSSQATGHIKAFVRPSLTLDVTTKDIAKQIVKDEFRGQRALIIGGSRGLGAMTAKILSLGGADVFVTYVKGKQEVLEMSEELKGQGDLLNSAAFDVANGSLNVLDVLDSNWRPTHFYYFATPFIFDGSKKHFSQSLFDKFCAYYVSGFWRIFDQLRSSKSLKVVMYPSSSALDEMPANMFEYSVAKAAGETMCAYIEKYFPEIKMVRPRLERLATDQTLSIMPVENKNPLPILLELLRQWPK